MNILYLHGFSAKFDRESRKPKSLSKIGDLYGITIDYTESIEDVTKKVLNYVSGLDVSIDLIVGISMGGWYANLLGEMLVKPFVMINPSIYPHIGLQDKVGTHEDFNGVEFTLTQEVVDEYCDIGSVGDGFLLLDEDDEIIDASLTYSKIGGVYESIMFRGGNHLFEHMDESLDELVNWYNSLQ